MEPERPSIARRLRVGDGRVLASDRPGPPASTDDPSLHGSVTEWLFHHALKSRYQKPYSFPTIA